MSHSTRVSGVVLAAGEGRRMGPLGERLPKACLPVGDRPLIRHQLDLLENMGIRDVVVVVGHRRELVEAAIAGTGARATFVEQRERRGIAHALGHARELVGDRFVVILGDTYFVPDRLHDGLELLQEDGGRRAAVLSIRREPDPDAIRRECSVRFDEHDRLLEIREKPQRPFNDLKPCGIYFFSRRIFEAIDTTPASPLRGEVELTDAIQTLVARGHEVGRASTVAWDCNLNVPADLLRSNLRHLRDSRCQEVVSAHANVAADAVLREAVVGEGARIGSGAQVVRSLVLADAVVPDGAVVADAIVGPDFVLSEGLAPAPGAARSADAA